MDAWNAFNNFAAFMRAMGECQSDASRRQETGSTTGPDEDECIANHENGRLMHQQNKNTALLLGLTSVEISMSSSECRSVSAPLSSLKAITISELIVGKRHYGRVLLGEFCVQPFRMTAVYSVLKDANAKTARVAMYNMLPSTASVQEIESRFPMGMRVAIKEPFYKLCTDSKTAVRVDNPADICVDNTDNAYQDVHSQPSSSNPEPLEELEAIRCEGNQLFSKQDWVGAVNKYSQCIDKAVSKMKKKKRIKRKINKEKLNHIVILAYSNRAEARLRLQAYQDAMSDADKALELDPKHVKSLVRKGKAANGLGLFEESCRVFKAALEQSPQDQSILKILEAAQSHTGLLSRGPTSTAHDTPSCADFMGPVEIRRVNYGCGRRGLFATEDVVAGKLLLVNNPLAKVRNKWNSNQLNLHFQFETSMPGVPKGVINTGTDEDLVTELADRIRKSKRQMAQLYSLAVHGKQKMEIPCMELFRPGSEWVPRDADKLQVDIGLIRDISRINSFGANPLTDMHKEKGDHATEDFSSGIWVLPSFANHSCAPNCLTEFIGDTMFVRAARDIKEGEELTISYLYYLYETVEARQAKFKNWLFKCTCERCLFEETLDSQLSNISKALPRLVEAARAETGQGRTKRLALKLLAAVVDEVEAVIYKLEPKQQGWIRASFIKAYETKFDLVVEKNDSESRILLKKNMADAYDSVLRRPSPQ